MKELAQEFGMPPYQPVIPGNRVLMVAGYPTDPANRGLFHAVLADDFDPLPGKARVVERGVFRFNEVFPAVFAEILLIPGGTFPILHEIFPVFDQEEPTLRILAGDRAVTARTGHSREYIDGIIKVI